MTTKTLPATTVDSKLFIEKYKEIRERSEWICRPLEIEDFVVQPIVEVSPPKWHLGHTTWFFETFVLQPQKNYKCFHPEYGYVFNSYYESVGERVVRANRGNLSRPTVEDVYNYRKYVDQHFIAYLENKQALSEEEAYVIEVGLNHEQQHQELLVTDIKYILGNNPLLPAYRNDISKTIDQKQDEINFIRIDGGMCEIGHNSDTFCYDNELERHKVYLPGFEISDRLISNAEFMEFIEDKGYEKFDLWLSEGWDWVQQQHIKAPMYWHYIDGEWWQYKMSGLEKVDPAEPVTHISYYEADAFATWKNCRLPSEYEWEHACSVLQPDAEPSNNFLEHARFHPNSEIGSYGFFGNTWEWTSSAYVAYPGFKKADGALGEYNGKFMVNQKVLRGGSCATPSSHIRSSYRNFFHPHLRWQFTGIRLAK